MTINRRDFLTFIGGISGAVLLGASPRDRQILKFSMPFMDYETGNEAFAATSSKLSFKPTKGVMPLLTDMIDPSKQSQAYKNAEVIDNLVLPEGFVYDVIATWGDPVGDSRFGYNNDYLSLVETSKNEGYLTVNFEYISSIPWEQSFSQVIGKSLPFAEVADQLKAMGSKDIDAWSLADSNPLKDKIKLISKEALIDLGIGVISVKRNDDGKWERTNSKADRRITGISGLEDGRYLKSTGAAVEIFRKVKGLGYTDKLGDRIIGTFLYKFVSKGLVSDPKDKANSKLLESGMLYAAKFNADGTGSWIGLNPLTPINPHKIDVLAGKMLPLPKRPEGGIFNATKEEEIAEFRSKFKTLGDLYVGSDREKQGAILIDAHYAANAVGATCTARPEDTEVATDGTLFIAFTSGSASASDGSPDLRIFKGKDGKAYEYGWIMRLNEESNKPEAMNFKWSMIATGGEPAEGGLGFTNPDNLVIDRGGHLWMVTDTSSDKYNRAVPSRQDKDGKPVSQSNLRGLYGNSSIWFVPTSGADTGKAFLFGFGPMESETTGPFFSSDQQTLFLAVQHPGEINGTRNNMAFESRKFAMRTTNGKEFTQTRKVPIGSNWPTLKPNDPPKPAVVAIRKIDNSSI